MHLTVGYLATPTGDDGVALAGSLAKTFGATVDVVLLVREELPEGHPGRTEYQQLLIRKARSGSPRPSQRSPRRACRRMRTCWSGSPARRP
jgi:hypothetical protein